jgi:hypothetical protein
MHITERLLHRTTVTLNQPLCLFLSSSASIVCCYSDGIQNQTLADFLIFHQNIKTNTKKVQFQKCSLLPPQNIFWIAYSPTQKTPLPLCSYFNKAKFKPTQHHHHHHPLLSSFPIFLPIF